MNDKEKEAVAFYNSFKQKKPDVGHSLEKLWDFLEFNFDLYNSLSEKIGEALKSSQTGYLTRILRKYPEGIECITFSINLYLIEHKKKNLMDTNFVKLCKYFKLLKKKNNIMCRILDRKLRKDEKNMRKADKIRKIKKMRNLRRMLN